MLITILLIIIVCCLLFGADKTKGGISNILGCLPLVICIAIILMFILAFIGSF